MEIYSVTTVLGKYFDWSKIPDQILAEACTRGSLVHSACAARALGAYVGRLPGMYAGYYESFSTWHENNVKATIFCEHRITCEKLGFTGQLDFVFILIPCIFEGLRGFRLGTQRIKLEEWRHTATTSWSTEARSRTG